MPENVILISIDLKIQSNYTVWPLEKVAGKSVLTHFFDRLRRELPIATFDFHVIYRQGFLAGSLEEALKGTPAKLYYSQATGRLASLATFLEAHHSIRTVCIFPEQAIFPSGKLTQELLDLHKKNHAEASVGLGFPKGLLPEIYQASALRRLQAIGLPEEVSTDFHAVMQKTNLLFPTDPSFHFKLLTVRSDQFPSFPKLNDYSSRLLVEDANSLQVVDVLLKEEGPDQHARLFKKKMLAIQNSEQFSFSVSSPGNKIPILYSTRFGGFTGAQECFFKLISHLDRSRFEPVVSLPYRGVLSEKLIAAGIPVEIGYFAMSDMTPWTLGYFLALLNHTKARVVHIDGDPALPLVAAAYQKKIPFVYHLTEFLGGEAPKTLQFATRIFSISEAVRQDVLRSDLLPAKVVTLFEGLDIESFNPMAHDRTALRKAAGLSEEAKVITIVARIAPEKRVDMIVQVLPEIVKKIPQALLLIVGESYPKAADYLLTLKTMIRDLKMESKIHFWGFEKEMAPIYALSDVLVSCRSNEPVGHSILEALAMKVPVVVPNRGGHNEILRHQENATFYEVDNDRGLIEAVVQILSDKAQSRRLAEAGRKTVERLDLPAYMQRLEAEYYKILD